MAKEIGEEQQKMPYHRKVLVTLGIAIPVILLLLLLGIAFKVVLMVMAAVLFAAIFNGIGGRIQHITGLPLGWSKLLAVLTVAGVLVVGWVFLVPRVADQMDELTQMLPKTLETARGHMRDSKAGRALLDRIPDDPKAFFEENQISMKKSFGVFSATFGVLADLYITFLMGVFFIVEPKPYKKGMVSLVPKRVRPRAGEVIDEVYVTLENWLKGKLLSMLIVTVLTAIGLWVLGLPLVLVLSLSAGLLAFIPNFGPILALIPALLVGMLQGPQTALYVLLIYVAVQFLESNFITPFIQREMVDLPLAMIIIAQLLLGILSGGLGLILATPILAVVVVLIRSLYVEDVLGGSEQEQ